MGRTVWIGLVCLISICGLAVYKISSAAPAPTQAASADATYADPTTLIADIRGSQATPDALATQDAPATKTDRLDVDYLQDVPNKTLVHTIPIVISDPAVPAAKPDPDKASASDKATRISRHWRSSYARLTRRHIRHQREVSKPAVEAKSTHTGLFGWLKPATM
jgi:hypothetical protein